MSFTFTTAAKLRYYENSKSAEILQFMKNKMQSNTTSIKAQVAEVYREILFSEVGQYIDKDCYTQTITNLENLFSQNMAMQFDESFFDSFLLVTMLIVRHGMLLQIYLNLV